MRCFDERLFNNNKMEMIDIILEDNLYIGIFLDEDGKICYELLEKYALYDSSSN